jgi:hypothetical protein
VKPANITAAALDVANSGSPKTAGTPASVPPSDKSPAPPRAKDHNIRVSPDVLAAAGKDGEELLRSLHTAFDGLTQAEAEDRERKTELGGERVSTVPANDSDPDFEQ